jgi:hypothetical protein
MSSVNTIFDTYRLNNSEYQEIDVKYGRLCYKIFSELKRKNTRNNYTEELDDVLQDLRIALIKAGCYTKRQAYLQGCMKALKQHLADPFLQLVLAELERLWSRRRHHGAHRQCFGIYQEDMLENLAEKCLPPEAKPDKNAALIVDATFGRYCKAIAWNCQKNIGKKITRERSIRGGLVSLSQNDFIIGKD